MDIPEAERIKKREIAFAEFHPDPNQAWTAAVYLADVDGILDSDATTPTLLRISYDLLQTTLQEIEDALRGIGLHLDNRLLYRVRRALYYYTEETQRANCGCRQARGDCTDKVFVTRYQQMDHGCRDQRPEHWRRYL